MKIFQIFSIACLLLFNIEASAQTDSISRTKSKWDIWNAWGVKTQSQDFSISESKLDTCNCYDRELPRKGNIGILVSYYHSTKTPLAYSLSLGTSFGRIGTKPVPTLMSKSKWLVTFTGDAYYHIGKSTQPVIPFVHSGLNIQFAPKMYSTIPVGAGLRWTFKNYPAFITGQMDYGFGLTNKVRNNTLLTLGLHLKMNAKQNNSPVITTKVMDDCIDSDGDGIVDAKDKCPTVAGAISNNGCPIVDTDGDGIPDDQDKCPTVAGTKENNGCPVVDTDGDGIPDDQDKCPTVAGTKDNSGCPEEKKETVSEEEVPTAIVYFDLDKSNVKTQYLPTIKKAAAFMLRNKNYKVVLTGHTDARANDTYNEQLSKRRAEAVKKELVKLGVEASRITDFYYGKKKPVVKATDENGYAKNRRVEFVFVKE